MFWTVSWILLSFVGWIAHGLRCQKCIYVCYSDGNKQVISLGLVAGIQNVENNSCFFMDSDEIKKYLGDNDVCAHMWVFFYIVEDQKDKRINKRGISLGSKAVLGFTTGHALTYILRSSMVTCCWLKALKSGSRYLSRYISTAVINPSQLIKLWKGTTFQRNGNELFVARS